MPVTLSSGRTNKSRRALRGGSAYGGAPSIGGKETTGAGTKENPFRASTRNKTGSNVTTQKSTTEFKIGSVPVSPGVAKLYTRKQTEYASNTAAWAESKGYGGASVPYSSAAGEGKDYVKYVGGIDERKVTSYERPEVLYYRDLGNKQEARGIRRTKPQQAALRAGYGLTGFATDRYAQATAIQETRGNTPAFFATRFAGDAAVFLKDPMIRYGLGDKKLGRDIAIGYAGGVAAGVGTGAALNWVGRTTTAKYGLASGIRAAKATRAGIAVGGGALGVGYLTTTKPLTLGRQAPLVLSGAGGFARGIKTVASPAVAELGSQAKFLGVKPSYVKSPNSQVFRTPQNIAMASSRTDSRVFSVFGGKPFTNPVQSRAFYSGDAVVTGITGSRYHGPWLASRSATLNAGPKPYKLFQSMKGTGMVDYGAGRSFYASPDKEFFAVGVITGKAPLPEGYQQVRSTFAYGDRRGYTGMKYTDKLSPDVTTKVQGIATLSQRGSGTGMLEVRQPTISSETSFTSTGFQQGPVRATVNDVRGVMSVAGVGMPSGIPRSSVLQPSQSMTYMDPTGGILSSLAKPRAPRASVTPRLTSTSTLKGTPTMEPGFGVGALNKRLSNSAFGLGAISASGSASRSVASSLSSLQAGSVAQRVSATPLLASATSIGVRTSTSPFVDTALRVVPSQRLGLRGVGLNPLPGLPPPPPSTPPPFGGLIGIPMFGLAGSTKGKGGGSRSYKYEPSLVSVFGNITGKEVNILTGQEVRPMKKAKGRKK